MPKENCLRGDFTGEAGTKRGERLDLLPRGRVYVIPVRAGRRRRESNAESSRAWNVLAPLAGLQGLAASGEVVSRRMYGGNPFRPEACALQLESDQAEAMCLPGGIP